MSLIGRSFLHRFIFYFLYLQSKNNLNFKTMESIAVKSERIVEESYRTYHSSVFQYIYYKIGIREEAEDLAQDVFVRLMDYKQMLCTETVKHFITSVY